MNQKKLGLILAGSGMLTYGFQPVLAHHYVGAMDPLLFGGSATFAGGAALFIYLLITRQDRELYSPKFFKPLFLIGFLGLFSTLFFFLGTKWTSGINSGLLLQLEPFYSIIIAGVFLGEAVGMGQIAATSAMILGALVIIFDGSAHLNLGDLLVMITPVFQQLSHVVTKKISHRMQEVTVIPAARLMYSGAYVVLIAILWNPASLQQLCLPQNWIGILIFGVIFRAVDAVFWYQAIKRIPLSTASAMIPVSVAVSFLGSLFFLKEQAELRHYLGLALIAGGVISLSLIHAREQEFPAPQG